MPRFAMKALVTALTLNRERRSRGRLDRGILIFSTLVTIGLSALYVWGKITSRW